MKVRQLSYMIPINVREERLNQLSNLAIGEAMGGELGQVVAESARRNLAVLDEIEAPNDTVTTSVTVSGAPARQRSLISRGKIGAPGETRTHDL